MDRTRALLINPKCDCDSVQFLLHDPYICVSVNHAPRALLPLCHIDCASRAVYHSLLSNYRNSFLDPSWPIDCSTRRCVTVRSHSSHQKKSFFVAMGDALQFKWSEIVYFQDLLRQSDTDALDSRALGK